MTSFSHKAVPFKNKDVISVYGIPNCDVTKLALAWLKKHRVKFEFHDYKKLGITAEKLNEWCEKLSWEILLNKRGTTWRKIDPEIQKSISNQYAAVRLMREHTSLIKRPVIETDDNLLIGFDESAYAKKLLSK